MGFFQNSEVVKSVSGLGFRDHERKHGPCVGVLQIRDFVRLVLYSSGFPKHDHKSEH